MFIKIIYNKEIFLINTFNIIKIKGFNSKTVPNKSVVRIDFVNDKNISFYTDPVDFIKRFNHIINNYDSITDKTIYIYYEEKI